MKELPQQTSKWFIRQINKYGCYFMSILFLACRFMKKTLLPSQVMHVYEQAIELKYMTFKCYVNNPAKVGTLVLRELGNSEARFHYVGSEKEGKLTFHKETMSDLINAIVNNVQILWTDKEGNDHLGGHFVTDEYDPDKRLRRTGKVFGKRYFYIDGGEKC